VVYSLLLIAVDKEFTQCNSAFVHCVASGSRVWIKPTHAFAGVVRLPYCRTGWIIKMQARLHFRFPLLWRMRFSTSVSNL